MANEFKIKKGLIVDGAGTVLEVRAANVPILTINDSKDGSLLAVTNANGFAVLSVSGSSVEIGLLDNLGNRPLVVSGSQAYITGSALLTNLTVSGSILQGTNNTAPGKYSHVQGQQSSAKGDYSYVHGYASQTVGTGSHAEGYQTSASGDYSHAQGYQTRTLGAYSHAEGSNTISIGTGSHAEGYYTSASANYQHVQGQFNTTSSIQSSFIIGNGVDSSNRRNLIYAYGTGSGGVVEISGSLKVTGGIIGATITTAVSSSLATNIHNITDNDNGKIILFRNSCTASIPSGLATSFECTIVSVTGSLRITGSAGSGISFLNNAGTTLPKNSSVTIKKILATEEFLTNGAL